MAARNPALIRDLAPDAPTLEGYLFPATYRITRSTTVQQLCAHDDRPVPQAVARIAGIRHIAKPVNETVTLASLVEKETGRPRGPSDRRVGL